VRGKTGGYECHSLATANFKFAARDIDALHQPSCLIPLPHRFPPGRILLRLIGCECVPATFKLLARRALRPK
jgi:hypothetical protein